MGRGRVSGWKADPAADTAKEVAKAFEPFVDKMCATIPAEFYTPTETNPSCMDKGQLDANSAMLAAFKELDPRGGFFSPADMTDGLQLAIESKAERVSAVNTLASVTNLTKMEVMETMSLKVRLMLTHSRAPEKKNENPAKRHRIHPFKHFRTEEDNEEDDSDGDPQSDPIVVTRYFKASSFKAVEVLSDGTEVPADRYSMGDEGMAIAHFKTKDMTLELANTCVTDDGQLQQYAPQAKAKTKAKASESKKKPAAAKKIAKKKTEPAAATSAAEEGDDEEGEAEEAPADAEEEEAAGDAEEEEVEISEATGVEEVAAALAAPVLAMAGGHDNSMVIFLQTSHKDKVQVASCSGRMTNGTEFTPTQVITKMIEESQSVLDTLPGSVPIKQLPQDILKSIREYLKQVRDRILNE